jgi:hypothetical protein
MFVEMWSSHKKYGLIVGTSNSNCKFDHWIRLGHVLFNCELRITHIIILSLIIGIEMQKVIRGQSQDYCSPQTFAYALHVCSPIAPAFDGKMV